jgi:RNA polymerase sigma factor (sigma-70 family)
VQAEGPDHGRATATAALADLSDDALVLRVRSGDARAFAEIHARYRAPLLAFARGILSRRPDEAEDVIQDAFLRAYFALHATDRAIALGPWLYMIVRNRAIDELRRPPRADCLDDVQGIAITLAPGPAEQVAGRDALRRLVTEIGRLPARQRQALLAREFTGQTHAQTALALSTTVPATKSLLIRARANLARELRDDQPSSSQAWASATAATWAKSGSDGSGSVRACAGLPISRTSPSKPPGVRMKSIRQPASPTL